MMYAIRQLGARGRQRWLRPRAGLAAAALGLLASACTPGSIGSPGGSPPGSNPPGGVNPPGTNPPGTNPPGTNPPGTNPPPAPPPQPPGAPVTGAFASTPGPSSRFVRLSHKQWENTVRDLFKLTAPSGLSGDFLSEPIRSSFDNNGSTLQVSNELWMDYQKAAETLGGQVSKDARIQGL